MEEAVRRSAGNDADVLVNRAALFDSMGRSDEAKRLYDEVFSRSERQPLALSLATAAAQLRGCVPPAIAAAHRALDHGFARAPDSPYLMRQRVGLWCDEGKRADALKLAGSLETRSDVTEDEQSQLAYYLAALGEPERARNLIERLAKDSESEAVLENAALIYFNGKEDAKALLAFRRAAEQIPDDFPDAMEANLISSVLRHSLENDPARAVLVYQRLAEKWPVYRLQNVFAQPGWLPRERQVLTKVQKLALAPSR
jgi:tetratricopeptide (TPR) repeat protein